MDTNKQKDEMLGLAVPDGLYSAIVVEASRRGTSVSGAIRQMLQESMGLPVEPAGRRSRIAEQMMKAHAAISAEEEATSAPDTTA